MNHPVSFDNLEIAFSSKSDSDLRNDYWLFKIIGQQWLVKMAPLFVSTALKLHLPIKRIIRATIFKHFCGGESIEDCNETIKKLYQYKVGSILDYSVEGEESEEAFDKTMHETIATIKRAKGDPAIPFCVFKPTGLARFGLLQKASATRDLSNGEIEEWKRAYNRFRKVCEHAHASDVRVFIDAEESWIQNAVDDLAQQLMMHFNREKAIVYNTVQLYRIDRLQVLKNLHEHAAANNYILGIKLVRGAYMEKERARAAKMNYHSPIQPNKQSCDNDFDEALRYCMKHLSQISFCAGTHNEKSSLLLAKLMEENNISKNDGRIWFSQLLGMSDHISFTMAHAGYNVCKYVPYGPVAAVLPYLIRRAHENTSISGQMGRELRLILAERKRRRLS